MNTASAALAVGGAVVLGSELDRASRRDPGVRVEGYQTDAYRAATAFAAGKTVDGVRVPGARGHLLATLIGQRAGCQDKYGEAEFQGSTIPERQNVVSLRKFTSFWLEVFRAGRAADSGDVWQVPDTGAAPYLSLTDDELEQRKGMFDAWSLIHSDDEGKADLRAAYWTVWALHHGELARLHYSASGGSEVSLARTRRVWSALRMFVVELDATGNLFAGKPPEERSWTDPGDLLDATVHAGGAVVDAVGGAAGAAAKAVGLGALNLVADLATSPLGAGVLLAVIAWKVSP